MTANNLSAIEDVEYDEEEILEEVLTQKYADGISFHSYFKYFFKFILYFDICGLILKGIVTFYKVNEFCEVYFDFENYIGSVLPDIGSPISCILCALIWLTVLDMYLKHYWTYSPFSKLIALNPSLRSAISTWGIVLIVFGFVISFLQGPIYRSLYGDHFLLNRVYDIVAHVPYFIIALGILLRFVKFVEADSEKELQMKLLRQAVGWAYAGAVEKTKQIYDQTHPKPQAVAASSNAQKGDAGEKAVNYKLHWWEESKKARDPSYHVLSIQYDCQSQYSNACIRLAAPHVAQGEPQEFDHLLVTSAGVIAIETKTYSGTIEVVSDGTWKLNGQFITSPNSQVERHHVVLFNILKKFQVPIHSVICIADPNSVIVEATNSSIPIVSIRDLESYLNSIYINQYIPEETLWQIFHAINNAKVGRTR